MPPVRPQHTNHFHARCRLRCGHSHRNSRMTNFGYFFFLFLRTIRRVSVCVTLEDALATTRALHYRAQRLSPAVWWHCPNETDIIRTMQPIRLFATTKHALEFHSKMNQSHLITPLIDDDDDGIWPHIVQIRPCVLWAYIVFWIPQFHMSPNQTYHTSEVTPEIPHNEPINWNDGE